MSTSVTTMSPEKRVSTVFQLLEHASKKDYIGDNINLLDHALQAAQLAKSEGADEETILAALLLNIGHLIPQTFPRVTATGYYKVGANYLRELGFPKKTCELITSHVSNKRYLFAYNPAYQNDPENHVIVRVGRNRPDGTDVTDEFETDPLFEQKMQILEWDDAASKTIASNLPALDTYRDMAIRNLS